MKKIKSFFIQKINPFVLYFLLVKKSETDLWMMKTETESKQRRSENNHIVITIPLAIC